MTRTAPSLDEFKRAAREAFHYLQTEFDCEEEALPSTEKDSPYQVWFANATTLVRVQGIGWGYDAQVFVGPSAPRDPPEWAAHVPLWAIVKKRRPGLFEQIIEASDQLEAVVRYAHALREAAPDVLQGDFGSFAAARRIIRARAPRR